MHQPRLAPTSQRMSCVRAVALRGASAYLGQVSDKGGRQRASDQFARRRQAKAGGGSESVLATIPRERAKEGRFRLLILADIDVMSGSAAGHRHIAWDPINSHPLMSKSHASAMQPNPRLKSSSEIWHKLASPSIRSKQATGTAQKMLVLAPDIEMAKVPLLNVMLSHFSTANAIAHTIPCATKAATAMLMSRSGYHRTRQHLFVLPTSASSSTVCKCGEDDA
eukprot:4843219-Pleurochrysis_carterae.AAC.1